MIDTPISETFIVGGGVGAAPWAGARPVVDMHYARISSASQMDEVFNQMARRGSCSAVRSECPLCCGHRMDSWGPMAPPSIRSRWRHGFTHILGLKVISPSNPYDAKMTLIAAYPLDDPVIYFGE